MNNDSEQANAGIALRVWDEVWNQGNLGLINELFDPQFVRHDLDPKQGQGRDQHEKLIRQLRGAFPDLHFTVDETIASGDKVVTRYHFEGTHEGDALGFPPTGKKAHYTGMMIQRFDQGKIVEQWTEWNALSLFQQLGQIKTGDRE